MLDLNVEKLPMEDSSTSNSSVLNEDEDTCSGRPLGFRFGILKNRDVDEGDEGEAYVTKEFFPPPLPPAAAGASVAAMVHCQQQQQVKKSSRRGPRSRSSQYRGVTFYRRTGRWESHIWDCGKQVYLGGFDTAHAAARAYDRAAIKFRGVDADINFNLSDYDEDLKQMRNLSKEEFVHILRRQSTGFSRGSSKYRGVTLHKCGRWEARLGQFLGKKAYDKAAINCNGREAVTNFEPSSYDGVMHRQADSEAIGHNLDLDLRISQPNVSSPKNSGSPVGAHFNLGSLEASEAKKVRIENSSSMLTGQPTAFGQPQVWTALYPGFYPSNEGRATEKRPLIGSSILPSWAWQMHGAAVPSSIFSYAASSGFATTTATAAIASTTTAHHFQFSPTTNSYPGSETHLKTLL